MFRSGFHGHPKKGAGAYSATPRTCAEAEAAVVPIFCTGRGARQASFLLAAAANGGLRMGVNQLAINIESGISTEILG
jgi:hypothetical protein